MRDKIKINGKWRSTERLKKAASFLTEVLAAYLLEHVLDAVLDFISSLISN